MPLKTLATPSVIAIGVLDPSGPYDIRFTYTDNQAVKNRAVIMDAETYETVYDKTQLTMKLLHTIPAGTLQTGKCYIAMIQVFDADGNKSSLSENTLFYCYSRPVFCIKNVPTVCKNAGITLPLSYIQEEGEPLKSYQFFLYDADYNMLNSSRIFFAGEDMYFTFNSLQNNCTYYYRAIGETMHGYRLDTGYHQVTVDYNVVPTNAVLVLENDGRHGCISIKTNIKSIGYELQNDNYSFSGGAVTLFDNAVTYNEGFSLDGDFSLFVEAKKLPLGVFWQAENGALTLRIVHICNLYYCEFATNNCVLYSPLPKARISTSDEDFLVTESGKLLEIINPGYDDDAFIVFEVKRIDSTYSLRTYHKFY